MVVQIVLVKEPELKPVSLKNVQSTVNSLGEAMVIVIVTIDSWPRQLLSQPTHYTVVKNVLHKLKLKLVIVMSIVLWMFG